MKHKILFAAFGASAVLFGCATNSASSAGSPSGNVALGDNAKWTGSIQSVMQSRGDVGQTTRDRSYGTLTWQRGAAPSLSNVNLVFTYAGQERFLSWAIIAGSCGTPSLPIIPMSNFPELSIGGGGRAQVSGSIPVDLPLNGSYHVDIYRSRQPTLDALVACGNLKLSDG
jgi:hypothetical protein